MGPAVAVGKALRAMRCAPRAVQQQVAHGRAKLPGLCSIFPDPCYQARPQRDRHCRKPLPSKPPHQSPPDPIATLGSRAVHAMKVRLVVVPRDGSYPSCTFCINVTSMAELHARARHKWEAVRGPQEDCSSPASLSLWATSSSAPKQRLFKVDSDAAFKVRVWRWHALRERRLGPALARKQASPPGRVPALPRRVRSASSTSSRLAWQTRGRTAPCACAWSSGEDSRPTRGPHPARAMGARNCTCGAEQRMTG